MKKLKTLGLAGLLMLGTIKLSAQDMKFLKSESQEYYVAHTLVDFDNDSIPDAVLAKYDLNKNGTIDTYAFFRINKKDSLHVYTPNEAYVVAVDVDEDGMEDFYYVDDDMNGTLDRCIKREKGEEI